MSPYRFEPHFKAFDRQRFNALARGIAFELTYPQWLKVWMDSGHIDQRGRGASDYCMSRIGDTGAYAVGNVVIKTVAENVREGKVRARRRPEGQRGVFHERPGRPRGWLARWGRVRLGYFATEGEAIAARSAYEAVHGTPQKGRSAEGMAHMRSFIGATHSLQDA